MDGHLTRGLYFLPQNIFYPDKVVLIHNPVPSWKEKSKQNSVEWPLDNA